jgi:hypothetical protein
VSDSATLSNFPGQALDVEFQSVKATTDGIATNLALIQRDDGALKNAIVDIDQLSTAVQAALGNATAITTILTSATAAAASASAAASSAATANTDVVLTHTDAVLTHADVVLTHADVATTASNAAAAATSASNAAATLANAVVGTGASTDSEVMLFSGATGKAAKRSNSLSGLLKLTSGVASAAAAGTDYLAPAAIGSTVQAFDAQLFSNIPQNIVSGATYTLVATDAQKHILHPSSEGGARTVTIPANASVAFPIGTAVTFVNQNGAGVLTISTTTDTMRLAGPGTTGSRTLAANGIATAIKLTATEWIISGTGLT